MRNGASFIMRIGITGATGFIGRALCAALVKRGDQVVAFSRRPDPRGLPHDVEILTLDPNVAWKDPSVLNDLDVVVHLAGETVAGRWTAEKKRKIHDSRAGGTKHLVDALRSATRRPRALISASATGYYGDRGDEVLDESSAPGNDFLAGVCSAWEREAGAARGIGMRVAIVRTGIVLGDGGALEKIRRIFNWGAGGSQAGGRQWMPWIHLDDLVSLYCYLIDVPIEGVVAGVAPDYATNGRVMAAVGRALRRPALADAPAFALRALLGEFADSIVGSQLVLPKRTLASGFVFGHTRLESAMRDALGAEPSSKTDLQAFAATQTLKASMETVFAFFSDGGNLARLTPPSMGLSPDGSETASLRAGAVIDYRLRALGLPLRWRALIVECEPGQRFADVQVKGPYLWWKHVHRFESVAGGVLVRDDVEYALPFPPLSDPALGLVRRDIEAIFAYRRHALEKIFGG